MEFKVGDRVKIKKNDIVGCIREVTLEQGSCDLNLIYYELKFVYAVISENRVYVNLKEEDLELIEKFKEPTSIEQLEQRIEKLEKEAFKPVVEHDKPKGNSLLTEDERVILRNINKRWKYLARDLDGELYAFGQKPKKIEDYWGESQGIYTSINILLCDSLFKFIKFEDDEPYNIEELLKGECVNE